MAKVKFLGVPHSPAVVIPDTDGKQDNVRPWRPGEVRECTQEVAERLVRDYADAGSGGSAAFVIVEQKATAAASKPAETAATK